MSLVNYVLVALLGAILAFALYMTKVDVPYGHERESAREDFPLS